jgi:vitamin B12 transporter
MKIIKRNIAAARVVGVFALAFAVTACAHSPSSGPLAPPSGRYVNPYQVTRLPELVFNFMAPYPQQARTLGIEGTVVLRLTINNEGKVAKAIIVKSAGNDFDESALYAVKHFKFKPGMDGDEAITTDVAYTYRFVLDNRQQGKARTSSSNKPCECQ